MEKTSKFFSKYHYLPQRDMLTTVQACDSAIEKEKWKSIVRLWYTGLSEGLPEYENRKQSVLYKVNSVIYRS